MMPASRQDFRNCMARLGAAVNVITTDGPGGRAGFTASAVCSVTDDPPTLLVCMRRGSSTSGAFEANGVLCVNALAMGHQSLSSAFSGAGDVAMPDRFALATWRTLETGAPVLDDAVVSFDCRIVDSVDKGTHTVLFAEVEAVRAGEGAHCLIYWQRDYHRVGAA
ncbi:flavin reductase [Humitalea sp. 24SJ18S-53]|uniref:flavin reductase n=1 Tax=Humitalea sp. 24SJ18S-53 TaxID=3422307 RepID=UPI003D67531A